MANKIEIKRFLESKQIESEGKLNLESEEKLNAAIHKFMSKNNIELTKINVLITDFDRTLDKLISNVRTENTAGINEKQYNSPVAISNDLYRCFTSSAISNTFKIVECEEIKMKYKHIIKDSKSEYERLLAVTQSMNAKDGILLLERLGFDVSEISVKKEVTALSTNIDTKKLYI